MNKVFDIIVYIFVGPSLFLGIWNWIDSFNIVSQIFTLILTIISIVLVFFKLLNEIKKYYRKK